MKRKINLTIEKSLHNYLKSYRKNVSRYVEKLVIKDVFRLNAKQRMQKRLGSGSIPDRCIPHSNLLKGIRIQDKTLLFLIAKIIRLKQ